MSEKSYRYWLRPPWTNLQLYESTARRQLKSPRSLSGRSIHLILVNKWSWSWSWMTNCHPLCAMSIGPPILEFNQYVCFSFRGNRTIFGWDIANSIFDLSFKVKLMAEVKPDGQIWALEFNRYVCFSFRGNLAIFGWDIANSTFDLENSRSMSWSMSKPMVTFES